MPVNHAPLKLLMPQAIIGPSYGLAPSASEARSLIGGQLVWDCGDTGEKSRNGHAGTFNLLFLHLGPHRDEPH